MAKFTNHKLANNLIFLVLLLIYLALGSYAFIYFFGTAFFADNYGNLPGLIIRICTIGVLTNFILSYLTAKFWPKRICLSSVAFALPTIIFGIVSLGNTQAEGPLAFFVWFGSGIIIYFAGLGGGYLKKNSKLKLHKS